MSRDDTIPCPEGLNRDSWAALIFNLGSVCVVYDIGTTAFSTDNARAVASTINEVMDEYEGRRE